MEMWKDIIGYEGLYQVSNYGDIQSTPRQKTKGGYRKPNISHGYKRIVLCKNGMIKNCSIHRLVAAAFISNPNNCKVINHKDENKLNNDVSNLEWCTQAENVQYSKNTGGILQYDLNNRLIKHWDSALQAERVGAFDNSAIIKCCKGIRKTHKCYLWKYDKKTTI